MRVKRSASLAIVLIVLCSVSYAQVEPGTIRLKWDALDPTTNTDLKGYVVYVGESSRNYNREIEVTDTFTTVSNLETCKDYFLAVKAQNNDGARSVGFSDEISGWARPIVTSVMCSSSNPGSGPPSSTITGPGSFNCNLIGNSLDDGMSVQLIPDDGVAPVVVVSNIVRTSCQSATFDLEVPFFSEQDSFAVRVISAANIFGGTGPNGFIITASSPAPPPPGDVDGVERDDVTVIITTNSSVVSMLDQLVATGLYGKTVPAAAEQLVRNGVEMKVKDGLITLSNNDAPSGLALD